MSQSLAYMYNREVAIDSRKVQYQPATPVYSRPGSSCSQPPTLFSNGPAIMTPAGSPPAHKATILLETELYDIAQFPSTPPLSTSSSTVGSPKSIDAMQTPINPMFSGFDGLAMGKDVFDSVENSILDWSSAASPPMTPVYMHTAAMNAAAGDILSVTSCPSLSPSPAPYARSLSVDQPVDFCDPRNLTVSGTPSSTLSTELTLSGLGEEEIKEQQPMAQPTFEFAAMSGMPSFEEISDLDSEADFSNLVNLSEISNDVTRPRACTGSSVVSLGHGSFIGADDELTFGEDAFAFSSLPSPPSSTGSPDDEHKNKKQKRSHKKDARAAQPEEIADNESVCCSEDASTPAPAPTSRRGRKQSLTEDPSKTFVCDLCNRRFRRQEHLKRHYRSLHTQEKPFECTDCGKKFSRSDNLAQHARTHTSGAVVMGVLEEGETRPYDASMMGEDYNAYGKVLFHMGADVSASEQSSEDSEQGRKKRKRSD